jgi:hypothetical protein
VARRAPDNETRRMPLEMVRGAKPARRSTFPIEPGLGRDQKEV